jgi:WD40 repeat protein
LIPSWKGANVPSKNERRFLAGCALLVAVSSATCAVYYGLAPKADEDRSAVLSGHQFPVLALAFDSADVSLTSAAGFLSNPREEVESIVWDLAGRTPLRSHTGLQPNLTSLALSPDGTTLATSGITGGLRRLGTHSSPNVEWTNADQSSICALAFSADGSLLASASRQNEVILWNKCGERIWAQPSGHDRFAVSLAFSPDGQMLASGGSDGAIRLWDIMLGKSSRVLLGHAAPAQAMAFSPDGLTLATGDREGVVKIWDTTLWREGTSFPGNGVGPAAPRFDEEITSLAFSPSGQTLAVAGGSYVHLWDFGTSRLSCTLTGMDGKVHSLAYSHDGKFLATGAQNGLIRIWDLAHQLGRLPEVP